MWRLHVLPLLVWVLSTTYDWKWGPWKRNFITYQCGFDSFCVSSCQYCDWQAISKECNSPTQLFLSKVRMRGIKSGWKEVERLFFLPLADLLGQSLVISSVQFQWQKVLRSPSASMQYTKSCSCCHFVSTVQFWVTQKRITKKDCLFKSIESNPIFFFIFFFFFL